MDLVLRQAIDAAAARLVRDPGFDVRGYRDELVELFDHATRRTP
ncbi:hypothetical protein [Allokutzneria albata]|nr:hypothetical protein [Allokutzneria albata]